jgi:hypothetical protein
MRIGIFGLENSSKTLHFQPMLSHNPYLTTHPPMQIPRTPPPKTATVLCPSSCSTIFREPYRLSSPRMVTTGTSSGLVTAVCGSPLNLFLTGTRYLRYCPANAASTYGIVSQRPQGGIRAPYPRGFPRPRWDVLPWLRYYAGWCPETPLFYRSP